MKFIFLFFGVTVLFSSNHELIDSRSVSDFEVKSDLGSKILQNAFMALDVDTKSETIKSEISKLVYKIFQACENSFEVAADKFEAVLFNETNQKYEDQEVISGFEEWSSRLYQEIFGESLIKMIKDDIALIDEILEKQKQGDQNIDYIKDLENLLEIFSETCMSLPENIKNITETDIEQKAEELVNSLKNWLKKWMIEIEKQIDVFLTTCFQDFTCQTSFKAITLAIIETIKEERISELDISLSVLENLILEIHEVYDSLGNEILGNILKDKTYGDGLTSEEERAFNMAEKYSKVKNEAKDSVAEIEIMTQAVVRSVPDTFLSVALGSGLIQHGWGEIKTKTSQFIRTVSSLSPSMIRVGGSAANFLTYDPHEEVYSNKITRINKHKEIDYSYEIDNNNKQEPKLNILRKPKLYENGGSVKNILSKKGGIVKEDFENDYNENFKLIGSEYGCDAFNSDFQKHYTNFSMTRKDWTLLVDFIKQLNWTLLFDLNQFHRTPTGSWDPTNAESLINNGENAIPIIWQLGNEPNFYHHNYGWDISPEEAARDFTSLRQAVGQAQVVGPDVTRPKHLKIKGQSGNFSAESLNYLKKFLENGGHNIDAISWHQYYVNGRTASEDDFLAPKMLNVFPAEIDQIMSIRNEKTPKKPVWITETATAWGGGAPGLSNRFVGSFPWLDKLGSAALGGVDAVFRQTLYGGCYALLDHSLKPYPDFWISVIYKQVVGQGVLLPRMRLVPEAIRLYAHCLQSGHPLFKEGALVIFGMNLSNKKEKILIQNSNLTQNSKYIFSFTAPNNDLKSRDVLLNGIVPELNPDGSVPELIPVEYRDRELVLLPYSLNFWVHPHANAEACL